MKRISALILVVLLLMLAGCSKNQLKQKMHDEDSTSSKSSKNENKSKPLIGFSIASDTLILERWNKDIKIFSSEIAALGGEVLFQLSAGGTEAQITQIEYLLSKDIQMIHDLYQECKDLPKFDYHSFVNYVSNMKHFFIITEDQSSLPRVDCH